MDEGEYWESNFSEVLSQGKGDLWRGEEENSRDRRPWIEAVTLLHICPLPPISSSLIRPWHDYSHSFPSEWIQLNLEAMDNLFFNILGLE